jgi:hypothetical protein
MEKSGVNRRSFEEETANAKSAASGKAHRREEK